MAYSTMQLNGNNLPSPAYPDGYSQTREHAQVFLDMADGSVAVQELKPAGASSSARISFQIEWKGLTQSEYETIVSAYNDMVGATTVFKTPLGESYYVVPAPRSQGLSERFYKLAGGQNAFDCRLSLQSYEQALVGP